MTIGYSYHRIIRKMVVAFGNLFNEIKLTRYGTSGQELESMLVPIVYGGKEKYVSRLEGDPNLDKKVQVSLPIMSFEMTNMSYDAGRKLNTNYKNIVPKDKTALSVYNPVPFDFDFDLFVYVRNIEDGAQIIEKILPFFTPDYTVSVNLIPEMGIIKQLPIVLKDVKQDIEYEGEYDSKVRTVIWTLSFTVKGYLYGAVSQPKVIRTSITNILDDSNLNEREIVLQMSNGFGNFKQGETVYQGYSFETATSTATVSDWISSSNTLTITNLNGHFVTGANVVGIQTNSSWNVNDYSILPKKLVTITVKPSPVDVVLPNNYTYTTIIKEYVPIFTGNSTLFTFDSISYDMSNTKTMDENFYTFDTSRYDMSIIRLTLDQN